MEIKIDDETKTLLAKRSVLRIIKQLNSNKSAAVELYKTKMDESKALWFVEHVKITSIDSTDSKNVFMVSGLCQNDKCQKTWNAYADLETIERISQKGVFDTVLCVYSKMPSATVCYLADFFPEKEADEYKILANGDGNEEDNTLRYNMVLVLMANLSEDGKKHVRRMWGLDPLETRNGEFVRSDLTESAEESGIMLKLCRTLIPEYVQREIRNNIEQKDDSGLNDSKRSICEVRKTFFQRAPFGLPLKYFTLSDGIARLNKSIVGRDQEKKKALKYIRGCRKKYWGLSIPEIYRKKIHGVPVVLLIIGPEGSGKELFAVETAKYVSNTYTQTDVSGLEHKQELCGSPTIYQNSQNGRLSEILLRVGDTGCVIIKRYSETHQCIKDALADVMTTGVLYDNNLECELDVSRMIFIVTANCDADIPRELLDQACLIHLGNKLSKDERIIVGKEYLLPGICDQLFIDQNRVCFEDDAMDNLCNMYVSTSSMDQIHSNLQIVLQEVAIEKKESLERGETVSISDDYARSVLFPESYEHYVRKLSELEAKFRCHRGCFSIEDQDRIEELFEEYRTIKEPLDREQTEEVIRFYVNYISVNNSEISDFSRIVQAKAKMNETQYGHEDAKRQVIDALMEAALVGNGSVGSLNLFLYGPAGTGKTMFSHSIADALGLPLVRIPLNGMIDPSVLKGSPRGRFGSHLGILAEKISKCGKQGCVVILDEGEKAGPLVHNALFDITDPSEGGYVDEFLGEFISTNNIIFIMTGNSADIPGALMDRFKVIRVEGYTTEDKMRITHDHVIPKCLENMGLKNRLRFSDDAIQYMIPNYIRSTSVREIERTVRKVIVRTFETRLLEEGSRKKAVITRKDINDILGAVPVEPTGIPDVEYTPGMVNCLAVRQDGSGCVFTFEAVLAPYMDGTVITGSCSEVIRESIRIAEVLVSNMLNKKLDNMALTFSSLGIPKEGASCGLNIVMGILSACLDIRVPETVAATGEICLKGFVHPIAGLGAKLDAARQKGINKIYIPKRNYEYLVDTGDINKYVDLILVPVNNVRQVAEDLFKGVYHEEKTCFGH